MTGDPDPCQAAILPLTGVYPFAMKKIWFLWVYMMLMILSVERSGICWWWQGRW
jgi:hypothetical protein